MSEIRLDASSVLKSVRRNQTPYWGEHTARYIFAAPYLEGRRVLDIACGTGYGLAFLGDRTRFLVGADLDFDAVKKARAEIGNSATTAIVSDGCRLPFADGCFDAITSFETLEHLEERPHFLSELRRVLAPHGLCIISTPNANFTQPLDGRPRNPHHVFEYTPEELINELRQHFSSVELLGQELDSRFVISPFWDDQQKLSMTPRNLMTLFVWRVLNKFPFSLRDSLSNAFWGHSFFPGERDYLFDRSTIQFARVLVAVCST
jgi:SAM-dependent methyltransferase